MTRILIAGWPKSGKTTLAKSLHDLASGVRHADDLMATQHWTAAALEVSTWIDASGPWIIEGVSVPRALRKWFERSQGKPAEVVYWSNHPKVPLTRDQRITGKGCEAVWDVVRPELLLRGVEVRQF